MTIVVADTGDIEAIARIKPEDATTNPSLLLKAAQQENYQSLLNDAVRWAKKTHNQDSTLANAADKLAVNFGCEILQHIPGLVSTEVDAHLSFNTDATFAKAQKLIALYEAEGIPRERILIKIASTWEGIQAAKQLEAEGIHCNLTLLFNFSQAVACAEANVTLISPFVGRILDWHKVHTPDGDFSGKNDPGVQSVSQIYHYYKAHQYTTTVMGASFRNIEEIEALAGCDKLTISPELLNELANASGSLQRALTPTAAVSVEEKIKINEATFRWQMNEDAMASDKLAEGIRRFAADQRSLEAVLTKLI